MAALFPDEPKRKQPTGPHPDCVRAWDAAWLRTRGCVYVWTPKDAALIAKALKMAGGDPGVVATRIDRLLEETEDQWVARNATPGVLVTRWNLLAVEPPKPKNRVTPLPAYIPTSGPRIPPPTNLMDQLRAAKEAALRATAARTNRRPPSSSAG